MASNDITGWREAVAANLTCLGYREWVAYNEDGNRYICATTTAEVYVYIDPTTQKVAKVVVDDDSLCDPHEMYFCRADSNYVIRGDGERPSHLEREMACEAMLDVWPEWEFGW